MSQSEDNFEIMYALTDDMALSYIQKRRFYFKNKHNLTLLMACSKRGYVSAVYILLKNGVDPNLQDKNGKTALMYATSNNHKDIVRLLLAYKANPNIQDMFGITALMEASSDEILKLLLESGADANIKSKNGKMVLFEFYKGKFNEKLRLLVSFGCDVNIESKYRHTLIDKAISNNDLETIYFLIENGANIIQDKLYLFQGKTYTLWQLIKIKFPNQEQEIKEKIIELYERNYERQQRKLCETLDNFEIDVPYEVLQFMNSFNTGDLNDFFNEYISIENPIIIHTYLLIEEL